MTAILKVIMRLVAQRLDFIHPGESFVLVVVFFLLYSLESFSASQLHADFNSLQLLFKLSFGNSALELLGKKRLVRNHFYYFV